MRVLVLIFVERSQCAMTVGDVEVSYLKDELVADELAAAVRVRL